MPPEAIPLSEFLAVMRHRNGVIEFFDAQDGESVLRLSGYESEELMKFAGAAATAAVNAEPECPDHMPDELWQAMANDRDAVEQAIRIAVSQTKTNILARFIKEGMSHAG